MPCFDVRYYITTMPANFDQHVLHLEHDASSWRPGDIVVVASTDFDWEQAERFEVRSAFHPLDLTRNFPFCAGTGLQN